MTNYKSGEPALINKYVTEIKRINDTYPAPKARYIAQDLGIAVANYLNEIPVDFFWEETKLYFADMIPALDELLARV